MIMKLLIKNKLHTLLKSLGHPAAPSLAGFPTQNFVANVLPLCLKIFCCMEGLLAPHT